MPISSPLHEHSHTHTSSVVEDEINQFAALAAQWWDPKGPMAPLHAMNPLRTSWVFKRLPSALFSQAAPPSLLDIGCGAGIACERFASLGFNTLGVDASQEGIKAAQTHLERYPLPPHAAPLHYICSTAEALLEEGRQFDVISALEVIEHVRDPQEFLSTLVSLTKPGGYIAISTMDRSIRSFLMAKLGAEYLLRLLPIGTHDWKKFIRPAELDQMARRAGLRLLDLKGLSYRPPQWYESHDTSVNYIALFHKP
ncbi:bifunctional 2-polyprenyl-6-hydroxyphenol methylase/3-demethylubiquinol 3-O-methyltransferase UbiG [Bombella sp. ESL0378]|uniref:bifunctional 2-polyprenyl-6-hydroxyphenol methylase/3-demethylubiquinol 3-O-methyltransferase UbiG n=1 Tax=Bombella sp. ESL0378 TaxID=2676442 RepID=UPI0012D9A00F|nr:bifunctional 2-polyprenyl-6-hydroxyphenol methylase/3-demethylubiquinol 3-O-methyltransferase UbiG [Bombella sp. ESL0378]MUG04796.1 bifunctional 2-polyprenyl-6-hydroxyphenol methylase/3-demethylubiquinol 3-O-methyltransferase UbiG [Bombella sp. ESL0378]